MFNLNRIIQKKNNIGHLQRERRSVRNVFYKNA